MVKSYEQTRQEKLDLDYEIFGIVADFAQLARAIRRGEMKGIKKNINQIIKKLDKISKKI